MRTKMENFVDKNYPLRFNNKTKETIYGKPEKMSYCDAINEMLVSTDSRFTSDAFVMMIRQRLTDKSINVTVFMKFCRWLYNQFSDKSCHKMAKYAPLLPSYDDTEGIKTMFKDVKIDQDLPAVICVQIILEPLQMPPTGSTSTGSPTN